MNAQPNSACRSSLGSGTPNSLVIRATVTVTKASASQLRQPARLSALATIRSTHRTDRRYHMLGGRRATGRPACASAGIAAHDGLRDRNVALGVEIVPVQRVGQRFVIARVMQDAS